MTCSSYLAAAIQLTTTPDPKSSLDAAEALVARAATLGAKLVVLPENVSVMGQDEAKIEFAEDLDGPTFLRVGSWAGAHRIWLLAGTLPEKGPRPNTTYNTSTLWDPSGRRVAVYRKIHLFDVDLPDGTTYRESTSVVAGSEPVVALTPLGSIGFAVCYDLRFPLLFRSLALSGSHIFVLPSAFTVPTGRDHWEILVRARAIENQSYVIAAAQFGDNAPNRRTFGRSMIVDPWGTVLATAPDRPGVALAEIDLPTLEKRRKELPCMRHDVPIRPSDVHVFHTESVGAPGERT